MGRRFLTPIQDASLYEQFPQRNTGYDEILEIGKSSDGLYRIRGIMEFDLRSIEDEMTNLTIPLDAAFWLNLRIANAEDFKRRQVVQFFIVSQSWVEGTGFFAQDTTNPEDGASWQFRQSTDDVEYSESYEGSTTQSFTASADVWGTAFSASYGGTYISGSSGTQVIFGFKPGDIRIDATGLFRELISGSAGANYGILMKLTDEDEATSTVKANLKFFSNQTHTIYPPMVEVIWDSQVYSVPADSGLSLAPEDYELYIPNARSEYVSGSMHRIRIGIRDRSPVKTFTDTFRFGPKYYLPSASYYSIKDAATNAEVIPFDAGSKINADGTGSYFDFQVENMFINRTYKILVLTEKPWGNEIIDTGHRFKVR
jgi:hypothetical protein